MLIKNLTKRERYIAAATLVIVVTAVLYGFIIEPICGWWASLERDTGSKMAALEKDSKILTKKKALESDYARFSRYLKKDKSEEEAAAGVMGYIENISGSDSCLIVSMKPVGIKKSGSYKEIMVEVTAEANMAQLSKFLYDIENPKEMILTVKRFVITPKSGAPNVLKGTFLISKLSVE